MLMLSLAAFVCMRSTSEPTSEVPKPPGVLVLRSLRQTDEVPALSRHLVSSQAVTYCVFLVKLHCLRCCISLGSLGKCLIYACLLRSCGCDCALGYA